MLNSLKRRLLDQEKRLEIKLFVTDNAHVSTTILAFECFCADTFKSAKVLSL